MPVAGPPAQLPQRAPLAPGPPDPPDPLHPRAQVVRLWVHECERVFADRLVSETDMAKFNEFRVNVTRKFFEDLPQVWAGLPLWGRCY